MKPLLLLVFLFSSFLSIKSFECVAQERIDTIFYDANWKGVPHKAFADYYRIAYYPADANYKKIFRDFYITGELQSQGEFISIDKYDDSKSVFDGEIKRYTKQGRLESCDHFVNGKRHGLSVAFSDEGICFQQEFENGQPKYDYYVASNGAGLVSKLHWPEGTVYIDNANPQPSDIQTAVDDEGILWNYYRMNGITLYQACVENAEYGFYHRILFIIENNTLQSIEIDPSLFSVTGYHKSKNRKLEIELLQCEDYNRKIRAHNIFLGIAKAMDEAQATAGAGYSTQTTTSTTTVRGTGNAWGSVYAYGSDGSFASANYTENASYRGSSTTTSTTVVYDPAEAARQQAASQARMDEFMYVQQRDYERLEAGYLKKCVVNPGQRLYAYMQVDRDRSYNVFSDFVVIQGVTYQFTWDVEGKRPK